MNNVTGLTLNQKKAVETNDKNLAVSAGAGTGKTGVLVKRFSRLLVDNLADLDGIAAITFTNKAALEMKQRIREELKEIAEKTKDFTEKTRLQKITRQIEQAQISTIHSLCSKILRAYPLEAGIDPRAELLEELDNQLLLEKCLNNLVDDAVQQGEDWITNLILEYNGERFLAETINLYQKIRASGKSLAEVKNRDSLTKQDFNAVIDEQIRVINDLTAELSRLSRTEKLTPKTGVKIEQFSVAWESLKKKLHNNCFSGGLPSFSKEKKIVGGSVSAAVKETFKQIGLALEMVEQVFVEKKGEQVQNWLFILLEKLDHIYNHLKEENNFLDFIDLELLTLQLFENYPDLAGECRSRFKYIMVDEVQDINPVQERLIYYLTCEDGMDSFLPAKLFVVGDEKQSIYRFRGADVEVFTRLKKKITAQNGLGLDLDKNFRSRRQLVEFFNYFFSFLMGSPEDGIQKPDYEAVYKKILFQRDCTEQEPLVELLTVKTEKEEKLTTNELRVREAGLIAARIAQMVQNEEKIVLAGADLRAVHYGDIAILLRATTDLVVYEQELRKRNIPYLTSSGRGFYARQEIKDVLNFVQYLIEQQDDLKLAGILRSPFFGLSDSSLFWLKQQGGISSGLQNAEKLSWLEAGEKEKLLFARNCLSELATRQNTLSLSELMREIVNLTGYEEVILAQFFGRQAAANLHKLFAVTEHLEQRGTGSLQELVRYLNLLAERDIREGEAEVVEEGEDAVRIMTIHGAKGLEFPIVFVPDLSRRPQDENRLFIYDDSCGLGIKLVGPEGDYKPTLTYQQLKQRLGKLDRAENKRLFYVALTRAEDYLVLGMNDNTPLKVPKDLKEVSSPLDLKKGLLDKKNDWLSWLKSGLGYIEGLMEPIRVSGIIACADNVDVLVNYGLRSSSKGDFCSSKESGSEQNMSLTFPLLPVIGLKNKRKTWSLSPTSLLTYLNCPRKFYFSHRICLPPLSEAEENSGEKTELFSHLPAWLRGNLVHRFCEIYEEDREPELVLEQCAREEGIPESLLPSVKSQCLPMIKNYLQSAVYAEIRQSGTVYSEWPFYYQQDSFRLQGKIDKLILTEKGLRIIDFKTDWLTAENLEKKAEKYRLQLELYCLAAARILKQPVNTALLYFVNADITSVIPFSAGREKEVAAQFEEISRKTAQDDFNQFAKREVDCVTCGYKLICSNC